MRMQSLEVRASVCILVHCCDPIWLLIRSASLLGSNGPRRPAPRVKMLP